jgi:hypothetical protein
VELGELTFKAKEVVTDGKTLVVRSNDDKNSVVKRTLGVDKEFVEVAIGELPVESFDVKVFGDSIIFAVQSEKRPRWTYKSSLILYSMEQKKHTTYELGSCIIRDFHMDAKGRVYLSLDRYDSPLQHQIVRLTDGAQEVLYTHNDFFGKLISIDDECIVTFDVNSVHKCFRRLQVLRAGERVSEVTTFSGLDQYSEVLDVQMLSSDKASLLAVDERYPTRTQLHIIDVSTGDTLWKQQISEDKLLKAKLNTATGQIVATDYRNTYLFSL